MSYSLQFYSLPPHQIATPDQDADAVAAFIEQHGKPVGEIYFRAAESLLYFEALEALTGLSATPLYSAPLFGVEPGEEDPIFGGLDRAATERLIPALQSIITNPDQKMQNGLSPNETAKSYTLPPESFLERTSEMIPILVECLADGGRPVTLYS